MATVYLADDLKHERKVALKVLKPELAAVVGAERFLAEIKTTANLQHPHILPLHDSGEADSFLFYVMPYVEGESLRERIDRDHQLPVDVAVSIATKVAGALQAAHERGVIHRDIKPANILLSKGEPLVADFGIALAVGAAGGGRLTETGLSLGTPHYMSPEQATGDVHVGPATDIYALGCVLYEMLIGEPPYTGSTPQAVLGKIITEPPAPVTKQRKSVPANVEATVNRALEKVPADRFSGAADFTRALADPGFRHGDEVLAGAVVSVGPWKRLTMAMTVVAILASAVAGWALLRLSPAPPLPVERFVAPFGDGQEPTFAGSSAFNLSPDGSMLVYRGFSEGDSESQLLLVRRWDDLEPSPIRGTEGGTQPVVSPDGQEVAFRAGGEVKVVSLQGGPVRTLTTGVRQEWGTDGYIYVTSDSRIVRVPATGGPPEPVTEAVDGELHYVMDLLPGEDVALVDVILDGVGFGVRALRLATGEMKALEPGTLGRYADSGHLVYIAPGGTLMAARFDPEAMELLGPSVALLEGVAAFSISDTGKLFYTIVASVSLSELVWVTRSGQATSVDPGHSFVLPAGWGVRLSPDGTRVVFGSETQGNADIRVKHLPGGADERISFAEVADFRPFWTPDGQSLTYFSSARDVWTVPADGTERPSLLLDDERRVTHGSWSPDGKWLVLATAASAAVGLRFRDILVFRPGVDTAAAPLVASTEFAEAEPELSPDGRWLAYSSNETGREEVFVRPFPNVDSTRIRASIDGGLTPVWARSGVR